MDMIRHHNEFVYGDRRKVSWNRFPTLRYNPAKRAKHSTTLEDPAKRAGPIPGTNCDEIRSGDRVVVVR
jgi:hypothetical protein